MLCNVNSLSVIWSLASTEHESPVQQTIYFQVDCVQYDFQVLKPHLLHFPRDQRGTQTLWQIQWRGIPPPLHLSTVYPTFFTSKPKSCISYEIKRCLEIKLGNVLNANGFLSRLKSLTFQTRVTAASGGLPHQKTCPLPKGIFWLHGFSGS